MQETTTRIDNRELQSWESDRHVVDFTRDCSIVSALMIAASEDTRYGFAIGRVRALETTLLDVTRYDRLVRTRNQQEYRVQLADTVYGRFLDEDPEGSLEHSFLRTAESNFAFLAQYCADQWVLNLFRRSADVHNLKVLVKSQLEGREATESFLLGYGEWNQAQLGALAGAEPKALPVGYQQAVSRAVELYTEERNPTVVDVLLDYAAHDEALELTLGSRFLAGLQAMHADVENLRTFIRVRVLDEDADVLEPALLDGGTIRRAVLLSLISEEWEVVVNRFRITVYGRMVEEGIGRVVRDQSTLRLERLGRELKLHYLRQSRYFTFGYEPLVTYYLLRDNELVNLRRLNVAKAAGLAEADCRELVAYVE